MIEGQSHIIRKGMMRIWKEWFKDVSPEHGAEAHESSDPKLVKALVWSHHCQKDVQEFTYFFLQHCGRLTAVFNNKRNANWAVSIVFLWLEKKKNNATLDDQIKFYGKLMQKID